MDSFIEIPTDVVRKQDAFHLPADCTRSCAACRYCDDEFTRVTDMDGPTALCRRYCPVPDLGWACVYLDDWCGDFSPREGK